MPRVGSFLCIWLNMNDTSWFPKFIVVGGHKSGTSSTHAWIADHPEAFGSRGKKTYTFVDSETHIYRPEPHVSRGLKAYRDPYPIPEVAISRNILESTPASIYYKTALKQIADLTSRPKWLFVMPKSRSQIRSILTSGAIGPGSRQI